MTQITFTATVVTIAPDENFIGDTLEERVADGASLLKTVIERSLFAGDKRDGESVTVTMEYPAE